MEGYEGYRTYDWAVSWTTDGHPWHERGFHAFTTAQRFARGLVEENAGNASFSIYVERMMTVNLQSFLDAACAGGVELAPHTLATSETFA